MTLTKAAMAEPTGLADERDALVEGGHSLRAAFRAGETGSRETGSLLMREGERPAQIWQLRTGIAYRAHQFRDGRRAIVELYVPGDVIGIEAVLSMPMSGDVFAAGPVRYWALPAEALRQAIGDRALALRVAALFAESQRRTEALAVRIGRLDAPERVAAMLVDLHERMRRRDMIAGNTFNLRLTQQQIGDHLGLSGVHVNRVLRWLASERIAFVERQVVIINDRKRLRALAHGQLAAGLRGRDPAPSRLSKKAGPDGDGRAYGGLSQPAPHETSL